MTDNATEEPADPILIEIEREDAEKPRKTAKEPTRPYPLRRCNWWGHVWGVASEDSHLKVMVRRKVCVRGRGTVKGRCPAEQPITVPVIDTDAEVAADLEPQLPVFLLPVSEILRLSRHAWGIAEGQVAESRTVQTLPRRFRVVAVDRTGPIPRYLDSEEEA